MRLNAKVARKLRRKAEELSVGLPKVSVIGDERRVPRELGLCTRKLYQGLKRLYKTKEYSLARLLKIPPQARTGSETG